MQMYADALGDLRSLQKTRKTTKHMKPFGKIWNSGDKIRCFYPLSIVRKLPGEDGRLRIVNPGDEGYDDAEEVVSIISAGEWVHRIDAKALKIGYTYSAISQAPRDEQSGKPIGRDVLAKLANISRELLRIEKEAAIKKIANNQRLAEENRAAAIKECEKDFENKSPLIGPARIVNVVEIVAVPLTSSGSPEMTKAVPCYMDTSEKRGDDLLKILDGGRYHVDFEHKLLEVEYVMGASGNRKVDAKVSPDGILEKESIAVAFPADFETLLSGPLSVLPDNSTVIYKRNPAFSVADTRKLLNAFAQHIVRDDRLDLMEQDEDGVKSLRSAADLLEQMCIKINAFDVTKEAHKLREEAGEAEEEPELIECPTESLDEEIARNMSDESTTQHTETGVRAPKMEDLGI